MPTRDDVRAGGGDEDFDLVVIGSGPAGEKGATQAAYYGYRVAVVERRADPGGSAIAVSGVPVKALRDAAVYLTGWSRRDVFGIGLSLSPDLVMDRLRAHVTDVVTTMTQAVRENLERHSIQLVHGEASLGPGRTVVVRGDDGHERILRARVILIATGSGPHHPQGLPFDDPDVHDSETVLSIDRLPERLVVVGGGPVGTEYASIFSALGVEVTLVDRGSRLLPILDAEISGALADSLQRSGARLMFESQVDSVTRTAEGLAVQVGEETLRANAVLHALGRTGNVDGLGLGEAGVEFDSRGRVKVNDQFMTTARGVYAAGDITGPPGLASVAMEQARVAMCRAFDIPFKESLDTMVPTGIYTLPEVSMVGLTEEAARAASGDVATGRTYFTSNARARISGSAEGVLKLVFRQSDRRLLGAHILGEEATELIHIAQALLHRDGAIDEFIDTTFNFPTRADAYKYAAYDGLPLRAATLADHKGWGHGASE
jgi:NAD(P) transhydrogenase